MSYFSPGHDLTACKLEPHVSLLADSSEPGASFGFCVSLSLSGPNPLLLCLSLSLKNKINVEKKILEGRLCVWLQLRSWSCGSRVGAQVGFCADSSEPGAGFGSMSPSFSTSPLFALSLPLSKINIDWIFLNSGSCKIFIVFLSNYFFLRVKILKSFNYSMFFNLFPGL